MAGTTTRLLVLGMLRQSDGPVHGYDLRRELLARSADDWANVAPGSIYNALKTLVREELVEVVGTGREGARPERTLYRLTDAGALEFARLLQENLWRSRLPNHPLLVGLSFLPDIPEGELAESLRQRAAQLRTEIAEYTVFLDSVVAGSTRTPAHVAEVLRLNLALFEAEARWAEDLAARL